MQTSRSTASRGVELTISALRRSGCRVTSARKAVVEALARSNAPQSAEEVLAQARARCPSVGRASVFRTLQLLLEIGLLHSSSRAASRTTYFLSPSGRHHHLVCIGCGRTISFRDCPADGLEETLARKHGFEISGHQLEVLGRCPECRSAKSLT